MATIGLIGAGHIGSQIARLAVASGYNVVISNSRGGGMADTTRHTRLRAAPRGGGTAARPGGGQALRGSLTAGGPCEHRLRRGHDVPARVRSRGGGASGRGMAELGREWEVAPPLFGPAGGAPRGARNRCGSR
jgi:NADP oxidoreductase coenzyme F420-dependent